MEIKDFNKILEDYSSVDLTDDYILFRNKYELYDTTNENSVYFNSLDEVLDYKINDETIKSIIDKTDNFDMIDNGGRGAKYGRKGGLLVGPQRFRGKKVLSGNGGANGNSFPAYLNTLVNARRRSVEDIVKAFGRMNTPSLKEFSAALDELGFAHKYNKGGANSTAHLVLDNGGGFSLHNHPTFNKKGESVAWNTFSGQDLKNSARDNARGTIVTSNGDKKVRMFIKSKKFDKDGFVKGLSKARATTGNYDTDMDNWLRANQKKYGFKFRKFGYTK